MAFVAFYTDAAKAQRLVPVVIQNAQRSGARVERHGAVTIVWIHSSPSDLYNAVEACAPA
jgi:hypothetical protein